MMGNKIAFFDFCDTIIGFQTADRFIDFCNEAGKKKKKKKFCSQTNSRNKWLLFKIVKKVLSLCSIKKRLKLLKISGISFEELNKFARKYYEAEIRQSFILPVILEIKKRKEENYKIWIISSGYDIYLKYFIEEFKLDGLIATMLHFNKNHCFSGCIAGLDCIGVNKIKLIKRIFLDTKFDDTISYSDSKSDLPLLKWTKKGVVVSKIKSQSWAAVNKFEELIWA
ncbi:hypothetical protein FACS1894137_17280 [Spirochaetia bacterium]|nr:hypothetical protein FACS1894137_17280 [Spirochaetia bacterium]